MQIGFIGLGNMGGPMALNLIKAGGNEVCVYDMRREAAAAHLDAGELLAIAILDFVKPDVVLQGVGQHDVVVAFVHEAGDQPSSLIRPTGDGFKMHRYVPVLGDYFTNTHAGLRIG